MSEDYTGPSPRLIEAFTCGEVTKGGMAEAGWFEIGTIADDDGPVFSSAHCDQ